jgi:hypothetical protein
MFIIAHNRLQSKKNQKTFLFSDNHEPIGIKR